MRRDMYDKLHRGPAAAPRSRTLFALGVSCVFQMIGHVRLAIVSRVKDLFICTLPGVQLLMRSGRKVKE